MAQVDKIVYQQRLQHDPIERMRETERQRRRRLPRQSNGLQHTAEYSHGAPAAAEKWLDSGKSHRRPALGFFYSIFCFGNIAEKWLSLR